ncbi:MAG: response regulator [Acidobacteria bacterium]|nr:response regulator [Acidobacteriota bacterium]
MALETDRMTSGGAPRAHRPKLLVVDDDPHVLQIIRRFAENAGFDVTSCAGGRAALERVANERVHVAVIDLRMPDVDGLEVLRAIRSAHPDCQTMLMSGQATIDSAIEAAKLGAIDYLTKPFDFGRLKALLATVQEEAARRRRLLAAEREITRNVEFCGMRFEEPLMNTRLPSSLQIDGCAASRRGGTFG